MHHVAESLAHFIFFCFAPQTSKSHIHTVMDPIKRKMWAGLAQGALSLAAHMDGTAFPYKPLQDGEIRLAHFSRVGNQLHCRLEHVSQSIPDYHALSYVWRWRPRGGQNYEMKSLYINGKKVRIPANLADFIDTITQLWTPVPPFWVDAICINQNNFAEKNTQVRRMLETYKGASHIIVWLGKHDESSKTCVENIKRWHNLVLQFTHRHPGWEEMKAPARGWLYEIGVLDSTNNRLVDREAWTDFASFFETRQWWQRVWTAQEYCIPKAEKTFLCGDSAISHQCLCDAVFLADLIMGSTDDAEFLSLPMHLATATENLRQMYHTPAPEPPSLYERWNGCRFERTPIWLHEALSASRFRRATDPRDKVFAILGFLEEPWSQDPLLSIDYALDVREVFTNAALYLLKSSRTLDFLGFVLPPSDQTGASMYPSWVPDWNDLGVAANGILSLPAIILDVPGATPVGVSLKPTFFVEGCCSIISLGVVVSS